MRNPLLSRGEGGDKRGVLRSAAWVALGAGSVLSSQEVTRVAALVRQGSLYSPCRRLDWFDGEEPSDKLDIQIGSIFLFSLNAAKTWATCRSPSNGRKDG